MFAIKKGATSQAVRPEHVDCLSMARAERLTLDRRNGVVRLEEATPMTI
jgi:hypothetical protein